MRLDVSNSTIAGNIVTDYVSYGGGGGVWLLRSAPSMVNTIVADNTAPTRPDIRVAYPGVPLNATFSLIENPADAAITGGPNIFGQDPKLGPLGDNGGPTPTIPLLDGSPALDAGLSAGITTDQRGAPRPFDISGIGPGAGGDNGDIGSYERNLCGGILVNRVGTAADDRLSGTPGPDGVLGLGGKDTLKGLAGNDGLCGGPGKDTLKGGAGNDQLLGDTGKDKLKGGAGNDQLRGQAGNDNLRGQAGNDNLVGGKGNDNLVGGKGKDKLKGGAGKDKQVQ
jgi:Ca2+-binding RTX toxin-like protein